ncbi:alpha/beta fold hydrolase [Buchnera aphidicola]|uniref:Pimeloyl-[acyl-carrier protein] methyl ester esterase n=1 Tax=Buchnera aphidicola (Cinara cf. splendens/pseudotsugae 3390) TaxID=2518980 RepID=A0A451CX56_9GAMM|nr:alpha/beta fold hydrolase [Buchnera aphidicola]VFP77934.1 Pimeloyl-[acyl-carrier protein] methyl ester esterase [Buchnera aphidicola (Cinara cf. splendens/pseudotsugae 3390)]
MNKNKKKVHFSVFGTGKIHLILLHGWGLHSIVWNKIIPILKPHFTLHTFDLPGFGKNINSPIMTFKQISNYLLKKKKRKVIWIGWSMGGLLAHYLSLQYPHNTLATIYVASSPYFIQEKKWPGVPISTLYSIKKSILSCYNNFLKNFILIHVINTHQYKISKLIIKEKFSKKYPNPKKKAIEIGYNWLTKIDYRKKILCPKIPTLRIYGELDNLIPKETYKKIENLYQKKDSIIIKGAKHAPFLSHPKIFSKIIYNFIKNNV